MSSGISAQTNSAIAGSMRVQAVRNSDHPLYERSCLLLLPPKFMRDRLHGFERREKFSFLPKPKPRGISTMVSKYLFFHRDRV